MSWAAESPGQEGAQQHAVAWEDAEKNESQLCRLAGVYQRGMGKSLGGFGVEW